MVTCAHVEQTRANRAENVNRENDSGVKLVPREKLSNSKRARDKSVSVFLAQRHGNPPKRPAGRTCKQEETDAQCHGLAVEAETRACQFHAKYPELVTFMQISRRQSYSCLGQLGRRWKKNHFWRHDESCHVDFAVPCGFSSSSSSSSSSYCVTLSQDKTAMSILLFFAQLI